jgi:ferredoxin
VQKKRISLSFLDPDQCFLNDQRETVLDTLVKNGIPIKQACINGVCGVCLTPLLSGEIDYAEKQPRGLNEKEKESGYFLPCISTCKTDICIGKPKVTLR